MTKGLVVVVALASACYSTDGARSNGDGGNAGSFGGSGKGGTAGATSGSSGSGARGGATGQGGTLGSGGNAASGGTGGGVGGDAGTATGGTGGNAASSGTGGSSGNGTGRLGQACVTDNECGTTTGLTCLENDEIDGAGPPKGLCTMPCSSDAVCNELAPGAFCIEFPDAQGYCIESCTLGVSGEPKCNEREEFGCGIVGQIPGSRVCTDAADCTAGQLCVEGVCSDPVTACIPVCGGDYNCGAGQYCDLASGFCVTGEAEGLPIGASCDPAAEEDPCLGFCVQVNDTEGMCSADCTSNPSGNGCGFNGTIDAEAVCVWVPVYADPLDVGVGDSLFCGAMCDCNDECAIEGWACFAADPILGAGAADFYGRPGLCAPLAETQTVDDTLGECPDTGAGGAGGAPTSGGSGGDGAPGGQSGADAGGEGGQAAPGAGGVPTGVGGVSSEP